MGQCGYTGALVGKPPEPQAVQKAHNGGEGNQFGNWVNRWPSDMPWDAVADRLGGWPSAIASATAFAAVDFLAVLSVQAEAPPAFGWSPAREMAGQGIACFASGLAGSAPIGGSLSR